MEDLDGIGAQAIFDAVEKYDVIAIDEIGPMELFSQEFKEATQRALESGKLVVAVVHWKAQDKLIIEARKREDAETITVTYENRDKLHEQITDKALKILKQNLNHMKILMTKFQI
jgi:nucleoside-triphosphatase